MNTCQKIVLYIKNLKDITVGKINIFCIQELKVVTRTENADLSSYEPISLTSFIDTNIVYSI